MQVNRLATAVVSQSIPTEAPMSVFYWCNNTVRYHGSMSYLYCVQTSD